MKKYENIHEVCLEPRWVEQAKKLYKQTGFFKDPDEPVFDMERVKRLLQGAMDTHIHAGPDPNVLRPLDEAEIAIQACELGMGAVAYKNSYAPSAYTARYVQKIVDQWAKERGKEPTRVIGGIVLGYPVGGLNAVAVRNALKVGGKIVWTPFVDSAYHHKIAEIPSGIEVVGEDDKVVPELKEIFKIIAKYDAVLMLCHHTTRERFILIDDAREEGVKRIAIVHPTESLVKMSIDQMKTAAQKGVYLELCCLDFSEPEVIWNEFLQIIREVGSDHIIIASDCGNSQFPPPAVQYKTFILRLLMSGVPDEDVEKMAKINPRKLIFD